MTVLEASVLDARGVTVRIGGLHVLESVSFSVGADEVLGIVGPNGAGKTTLYNVVSGLVSASAGAVSIAGSSLNGLSPERRARLGLSRTFQNLALYDDMSVLDNVLIGAQNSFPWNPWRLLSGAARGDSWRYEKEARLKAERQIERLGLFEDKGQLVTSLPFGRRRLVDLARALASDPKVVLLDEPFSGLTGGEKAQMIDVIGAVRRDSNLAVVLVEHDMDVLTRICDRAIVLNGGRQIAEGFPSDVLKEPSVREAYLGQSLTRVRKVRK